MTAAALGAWQVVLFDLDGTLIDSAPDLAGAGNEVRQRRGLPPLPLERFRPMTGAGARGMLSVALDIGPGEASYDALREEFLATYEARMTRDTHVFPRVAPVLAALDAAGRPWGIVTNKASRFAAPVVQAMGLAERAGVLVCGDTTARAKPYPDPLLEAARRLGHPPGQCVYVGDDLRDVQAGRAAGMATVAAAWGYLGEGPAIGDWGADHMIREPAELLQLLGLA
jgi:2-phosphoglycolate phosphatase